jgi:hypothetical protein
VSAPAGVPWLCTQHTHHTHTLSLTHTLLRPPPPKKTQPQSIAQPVPSLSTGFILTTEWVDGEKLSESNAGDVRTLCSTLLNAYLIQLLETGFLHAGAWESVGRRLGVGWGLVGGR